MSSWLERFVDESTDWHVSTIEALDGWVNKPGRPAWRCAIRFAAAMPVLAATITISLVVALVLVMIIAIVDVKDLIQDAQRRRPP